MRFLQSSVLLSNEVPVSIILLSCGETVNGAVPVWNWDNLVMSKDFVRATSVLTLSVVGLLALHHSSHPVSLCGIKKYSMTHW